MLEYIISGEKPLQHYLHIQAKVKNDGRDAVPVQISAWRPGRYELQNYAAHIRGIFASDIHGNQLHIHKDSRNRWIVFTPNEEDFILQYDYYANQMDAGGCVLNDEQIYLNFIACLIYPEKYNGATQVVFQVPDDYKFACGIKAENKTLNSTTLERILDSPIIVSPNLQSYEYFVHDIPFNVHIQGAHQLPIDQFVADMKKCTEAQLASMGEFPEEEYHYLCQFLPNAFYHGVEHRNSSVNVLGPGRKLNESDAYLNLLGLCSHELFHAWNICKIRPAEMQPYRLHQENYFRTGFVAEGFTTYLGDYYLLRSGVISPEQFLEEINTHLHRHFENIGYHYSSLAESGFDLWIDGYVPGDPNKKVSIYVKGALVALLLDAEIRKNSGNQNHLEKLLRKLYTDFAKNGKGYTEADILYISSELANSNLKTFFDECVYGRTDLVERLKAFCTNYGFVFNPKINPQEKEKYYGIRLAPGDQITRIEYVHPDSTNAYVVSKGDVILTYPEIYLLPEQFRMLLQNGQQTFLAERNGKRIEVVLKPDTEFLFKSYQLEIDHEAGDGFLKNRKDWFGF